MAQITIRLRGPTGNFRIQAAPSDDVSVLYAKCADLAKQEILSISNQPNNSRAFPKGGGATLEEFGIKHGDMLFFTVKAAAAGAVLKDSTEQVTTSSGVKEHPIDELLSKENGLIKRTKDVNFCRHGANGMCDYCMPLEPYDQKYLSENKIKHMSFQSYLRKVGIISTASNKKPSVSVMSSLEEPSFKVDPKCDAGHEPYPKSMCAKCQPSAVVLQQQTFRFIDHVEFESPGLVDSFIGFWRATGLQRFGYLYGKYDRYNEVPLGIKAVVSAIYEPPQKSFVDGIELLEEEFKKEIVVVDEIAAEFGLERIGMIYTDLTDDGTGTSKVICRRHVESFFVSSVESVFMALEQLEHKNKTKYSSSGEYGSKFATVIISGDTDGNIHLSAYQVSVTCMSLVRDGIVDASVDPHLMLVRESTPTHYVPEVFFKYKDKYGVTVQEAAKPTFPVDYFIVTVTEGFPHLVNPFFKASNFPIENRGGLSIHNMNTLADHLDKFQHQAFSDFHFLLYLKKIVTKPVWDEIVYSVVKNRPVSEGVVQYFKDLVAASKAETKSSTAAANTSTTWTCSHCTFINSKSGDCDMCGLPRE